MLITNDIPPALRTSATTVLGQGAHRRRLTNVVLMSLIMPGADRKAQPVMKFRALRVAASNA
jgi:hypothetical protein